MREAVAQAFKDQEHKDRSVTFSGMKTEDHQRLEETMRSAGVTFVAEPTPMTVERPSVRGYRWTDPTEPQQVDACMAWLRTVIHLPRDKVFVDVRRTSDLLDVASASAPWLPFSLRGTSDVAIADRDHVSNHLVSRGLLILFELKKVVQAGDIHQAYAQLIAADIHSNFSVVTILTDLNDEWHLLWTEERAVKVTRVSLGAALECLNRIVRAEGSGPNAPLSKRAKLKRGQ